MLFMSMNDYMNQHIVGFENLTHEINNCNIALPDTILAFRILEGLIIKENQRQIALTFASDLTK